MDISYDGAPFHGWQRQNNAITVQEVLEKCMAKAFQSPMKVVGAGRTDTGVHARQLIAHFDIAPSLPFEPNHLIYKLNRMLPPAIAVNALYRVNDDAHARFDALSRTYLYVVGTRKDPLAKDFSYWGKQHTDVSLMNRACEILKEYRNFQCFSKVKTDVKTYNCTIEKAYWKQEGDQIIFTIIADRFLRNMVRAIVGTLLEIGTGKRPLADLRKILESKDRCQAGKSMPAKALFLEKIDYPKTLRQY